MSAIRAVLILTACFSLDLIVVSIVHFGSVGHINLQAHCCDGSELCRHTNVVALFP